MSTGQHGNLARGRSTGVVDCSAERCRLQLTGADRVAFLHGQCTNDIRKLRPGESCYAAFLTPKGKMRGEGHILCLEDSFLVETSPGLQASLEKFIVTEDVVCADVSALLGEWLVVGDGAELPSDARTFCHPLGTGVIATTRLPVTMSSEELEQLRVEVALPKWGRDLDENTIPVEAGLQRRAISYDKGCYVGQETIARIKTYGHVNRRLVQLNLAGAELPAAGEKISDGEREMGYVTSAARSIRLGKRLALGYVRREFANVGNQLSVRGQPAEVTKVCGD